MSAGQRLGVIPSLENRFWMSWDSMDEKEKGLMEKFGYTGITDISEFGFPFVYACLNREKGIELLNRKLAPVFIIDEQKMQKILRLFLKAYEGTEEKVKKVKENMHQDIKKDVQTKKEEEEAPLNLSIDALTG